MMNIIKFSSGFLGGLLFEVVLTSAFPVPHPHTAYPDVLSVDSYSYTWAKDLADEAKATGECVVLERLPNATNADTNKQDIPHWWLHSCKAV